MSEPLEVVYFNWLCAKVMYDEPGRTVDILKLLYETEFVWRLPGDENRAEDGKELREDFFRETHLSDDPNWDPLGCSILEMMIAFAKRAEFQTDIPVKEWFWTMMRNIHLDEYRRVRPSDLRVINDILYRLVWRTYDCYGDGGLWPIDNPTEDQRDVEIWYQYCAYLEDKALL